MYIDCVGKSTTSLPPPSDLSLFNFARAEIRAVRRSKVVSMLYRENLRVRMRGSHWGSRTSGYGNWETGKGDRFRLLVKLWGTHVV